ncbi:Saposin B-type domain-containing protein [Mycena indigotica]|uniref:Saposin B-type domain-containing protein n=1 Tax=Mycena indigotica TaxID=2126181 RepID=A0A8H6SKG2_9AGAR|nr:Saposin B-type domain-containing protein [Mycena indigotica]KAF7300994.1 Saposin B-type domain-containing protein [Mycena indigotica]
MAAETIPPLDGLLGAAEIGGVVGTFLFGIGTLQTFNYFQDYPSDGPILKTAVAILWFLELAHSISTWHGLYSINVTFYGQLGHLLNPPQSLAISILFTGLVIPLVQTFYALRIRSLSGRWSITAICSVLTSLRFVFSMVLMSLFLHSAGFTVLHTDIKIYWVFTLVASLGPTVDIITATSLCYLLWQKRTGSTRIASTRRIVDDLILWTVETTAITCLAGIMQLIMFLTRDDLTWITFYLLQPKLFSNSMLASLNNRKKLRSKNTIITVSSGASSTLPQRPTNMVIQMHRMMETTSDRDKQVLSMDAMDMERGAGASE